MYLAYVFCTILNSHKVMVILNHIEGYYRELEKFRLGVIFKDRFYQENHVIAEIPTINLNARYTKYAKAVYLPFWNGHKIPFILIDSKLSKNMF